MQRGLLPWYWIISGGMIGFGFVGILSIGLPFLLVGLGMLVVGVTRWGGQRLWLAVIAFGAVPALLLAFDLLTAPPQCPSPGTAITLQPGQKCSGHYEGYYGLAAIFGAIALLGVVWPLVSRLWAQQHRP